MRKIYDPTSGNDVTTTVQSFLQAGGVPVTCFLYSFQCMDFWSANPYGKYATFCYTDFESNLFVSYLQQYANGSTPISPDGSSAPGLPFLAENISVGEFSYGIGFEDNPAEVSWHMDMGHDYQVLEYSGSNFWSSLSSAAYPSGLTLRQALAMGTFFQCPFWIHECYFTDFPRLGGFFLGTSLMFRGYIRSVKTTQSSIKLGLSSLMEIFNTIQVPTQTITPTNRSLPYVPLATSPYADTGVSSHYSAYSGLNATTLQVNTTFSIPANALQDSWINFSVANYAGILPIKSGYPSSPSWRIQGNTAGPGTIQIYFYEPFILPLSPNFNIFAQQTTSGGVIQGFLYVPPPEYSA